MYEAHVNGPKGRSRPEADSGKMVKLAILFVVK